MSKTPPSRNSDIMEVHRQPLTCQSVSPEVRKDAPKSPDDDFQDLRIAAMALGDPSDEMHRISDGLRSFVEKGQNKSIYLTAQELYDRGLAQSTTGNMAPQEREALDKALRLKVLTDSRQQFKSRDTNMGRDADGIFVQQHEPGETSGKNATIGRLLKLSEEFARDFNHSQKSDFNYDLMNRNSLRQIRGNPIMLGSLTKDLNRIDLYYDPCLKAAHMRRKTEIDVFYDSFDFLYGTASSASNDNKTSARAYRKAKRPEHKETVEELQHRILQLATAIQDDCAVLLSYLIWINWEKEWGLLDEGRYKAHILVGRLMKLAQDAPVPQSFLEALDSPTMFAISPRSGESLTIAMVRAPAHDDHSTGEEPGTFEYKLSQALDQLRNTELKTDGSAKVRDVNKKKSRKLMRMFLSPDLLATFSENLSKAVHDLFLAFTILNTMRPVLYIIRKQAKTSITAWTRASYKAWIIGYVSWHEIPVTQKYEQRRIEYLAMCENARILHEKLAPHLRVLGRNRLRKELPRVAVSEDGFDHDKRCNRVRRAWDMHIQVIKHMFPLVTSMIWEAGALVTLGARSETHNLDTERELEARLHYWRSLGEDDDCMPDEEGKEYWDIILPCTGCS